MSKQNLYQDWQQKRDKAEEAKYSSAKAQGHAYIYRQGCLILSDTDDPETIIDHLRQVRDAAEGPNKSLVADMINQVERAFK
jgi:hypothetical protein